MPQVLRRAHGGLGGGGYSVEYREPPPDVHPWYRRMFGWVGIREVPWAGLGWILLVAVLYSVMLVVVFPEGFWEWLSTFLATFLSVLAAIFLYRHQINRAEEERMFQMYLTLDADLEALLMRIDPSRSNNAKPLSITLPGGRVAEAYASPGEDQITMMEEIAKAGFEKWHGMRDEFMFASIVRAYAAASARFLALCDSAMVADHIGPNTEQALILASGHVERLRKAVIVESERMRGALRGWFRRYSHFNPCGPEDKDRTPNWGEPTQTVEGLGSTMSWNTSSRDTPGAFTRLLRRIVSGRNT